MNKNKGITLVALVITIIILLILAGITIAQLTGSGLFERAQQAEKVQNKETAREKLYLAIYELQLKKHAKVELKHLSEIANKEIVVEEADGQVKLYEEENNKYALCTVGKYEFKVYENLEIVLSGEEKEKVKLEYIKEGLLAWYDGEDNTGNGHDNTVTTWKDLTGNGHDANITGATWQENNLAFDGSGDYATADIKVSGEVTIEVALKFNSEKNHGIAGWSSTHTAKPRIVFCCSDGKFKFFSTNGTEANGITKYYTISSYDSIKHLSLAQSATTKNFRNFINGEKVGDYSDAKVATNSTQHLFGIGDYANASYSYTGGSSLNGNIYCVRVYNRALTDEEVAHNYEIDKLRYGI